MGKYNLSQYSILCMLILWVYLDAWVIDLVVLSIANTILFLKILFTCVATYLGENKLTKGYLASLIALTIFSLTAIADSIISYKDGEKIFQEMKHSRVCFSGVDDENALNKSWVQEGSKSLAFYSTGLGSKWPIFYQVTGAKDLVRYPLQPGFWVLCERGKSVNQ